MDAERSPGVRAKVHAHTGLSASGTPASTGRRRTPATHRSDFNSLAQVVEHRRSLWGRLWLKFNQDRALFLLDLHNPLRKRLLALTSHHLFDRAILLLIMVNCVFLTLDDPLCVGHGPMDHDCSHGAFCASEALREHPCEVFCVGWKAVRPDYECSETKGNILQIAEFVFSCVFGLECILKVLASGFLFHKRAYLRDGWNMLDFVVVLMGWISYIPGVSNLSALRTVRILRPLRTMTKFAGMGTMIRALLSSVAPIMNVLVLFGFVFFLFGIIGVQLLDGALRGRCFVNVNGTWAREDADEDAVCGNNTARVCPMGECLRHFPGSQEAIPNPIAFRGFVSFDNIGWAFLTIFQCITLEGWTDIMYLVEDGYSKWGSRLYFVLLVVVGSWFVINLALAVLSDSFSQSVNDDLVHDVLTKTEPSGEAGEGTWQASCDDEGGCGGGGASPAQMSPAVIDGVHPFDAADTVDIQRSPTVKSGLRTHCCRIIDHSVFQGVIMFMIVLNTITLGMEYHDQCTFEKNFLAAMRDTATYEVVQCDNNSGGVESVRLCGALIVKATQVPAAILGMDESLSQALEACNLIFTVVFLLEVVFKVVGLGRKFAASMFNVFDAVVVLASLIEIFASVASSGGSSGVLSVFRAARLFRVFKLARSWTSLMHILRTLQESLHSIAPVTVLLLLFVYVFSLLGMQLFGGLFMDNGENPRANFDSFFPTSGPSGGYGAAFTIFQMLTGENWNEVMYNGMAATSTTAVLYFVSAMVLGIFIIMNLFLAIVVQGFSVHELQGGDEDEQPASPPLLKRLLSRLRSHRVLPLSPSSANADGISDDIVRTFSVVTPEPGQGDPPLERAKAQEIERKTSIWDRSLFLFPSKSPLRVFVNKFVRNRWFEGLILLCIVASSVIMAFEDPRANDDDPFVQAMVVVDTVFIVIFILEMLLKILAFGFVLGEEAYLADNWNVLDFSIVIVTLLSIFLTSVRSLRTLRAFRALRPLRIIHRNPGMKNPDRDCRATRAPINATSFRYSNNELLTDAAGAYIWNWLQCEEAGGEWVAIAQNFDNVFVTLLTLFEVATLEGWLVIMDNAIDAGVQIGQVGIRMNNRSPILFFVIFVVIGSFLVLNIFMGVVIDNYNQLRMTVDEQACVTPDQRHWLETMSAMVKSRPKRRAPAPTHPLRAVLYRFVHARWFEGGVLFLIMLNVGVLASRHFDQSNFATEFQETANTVFTVLFLLEATLKLVALGPRGYFGDAWNVFDFVVVLACTPGLFVDEKGSGAVSMLRAFRIARLFRLVRSAAGLRQLLTTLLFSLPSLANIGGLLFLVFCIYSILGVQFFYNVKQDQFLSRHTNFDSFGNAFITLFRCTTGENWNGIMHECMSGVCEECPSDVCTGCGGPVVGFLFFFSFNLMCTFLVLNLFIAVILDNFNEVAEVEAEGLTKDSVPLFAEIWSQFDTNATQLISASEFSALLVAVPPPLGLGKHARRGDIIRFTALLDVPVHGGRIYYMDVLKALTLRCIPEDNGLNLSDILAQAERLKARAAHVHGLSEDHEPLAQAQAAIALQRAAKNFLQGRPRRIKQIDSSCSTVSAGDHDIEREHQQQKQEQQQRNRPTNSLLPRQPAVVSPSALSRDSSDIELVQLT